MKTINSESLIINARQELAWYQRLLSDTSTAVMWGAWLLLWRPVVVALTGLISIHHPFVNNLLNFIGLEHYLVWLFACAAALLLWSNLPADQVKNPATKQLNDYAGYFKLSEHMIEEGRSRQISTVYHDEQGKIIRIE